VLGVVLVVVPGALGVGPFCGSGKMPAARKNLRRRWLACEIESQTAQTARRRVA
jgi:DNA modification methylase